MLRGINFGQMDVRITIQSTTTSPDAISNEPVETWSDLKTISVKELNPQSREQFEAKQQVAFNVVRWMARRDDTLNETMRAVRDGETFYFSGIQNKRREGYMIITAEKRDNV
jgi:SPP1 family predicted phage head-tail adaptor